MYVSLDEGEEGNVRMKERNNQILQLRKSKQNT